VAATLGKEKKLGEFATLWRTALGETGDVQQVELAPAIADTLVVKDSMEQARASPPARARAPAPRALRPRRQT